MARNEKDLKISLDKLADLKNEFWNDVKVLGSVNSFNPELSKAERLADFIELGELMIYDALDRKSHVEVILEKNIKLKKVKR